MFSSASAIFWMYNDSWPVTNGWTIVDYYRHKKPPYHPVRRAFQPVTAVVADEGDSLAVYGVNDTPNDWTGELRYGVFLLAGSLPIVRQISVTLPANASVALGTIDRVQVESLGLAKAGAFAVLSQNGMQVAQHRLFLARFKDLAFAMPEVSLSLEGERLTLTSDTFAWGVCLDVDGELPLADNCFDLLPGIPYKLPWNITLGRPAIMRIGSRDAVSPV
ncbi:MAG: hypothetical protein PHT33_12070 [bacterium]|nr:hypothetical protein [bacterium]